MPIGGSKGELKMVNPNCRTLGVGLMVAGIFMSEIKPRHAASYHSMEEALAGVREWHPRNL